MHRAGDRLEYAEWLDRLEKAAAELGLSEEAVSIGTELFLAKVPEKTPEKRSAVAASLYAGALIAGERCAQGAVAEAAGVSRVTVQQKWKHRIDLAGMDAPSW